MTLLRATLLSSLVACSLVFGESLEDETVTAACGMCIFGQRTDAGCYWAIEWDGAYYPVNGHTPTEEEHASHGSEGMCTVARQAKVSGTLRKGRFLADRFELLPFDPTVPQPARDGVHDHEH